MSENKHKDSRRKFFVTAGVTAGAVAVVSQTPLGTAIAEQASTLIDDNNKGYKLSDHIRKYYKTTLV
jgi:hypothetical protein